MKNVSDEKLKNSIPFDPIFGWKTLFLKGLKKDKIV